MIYNITNYKINNDEELETGLQLLFRSSSLHTIGWFLIKHKSSLVEIFKLLINRGL